MMSRKTISLFVSGTSLALLLSGCASHKEQQANQAERQKYFAQKIFAVPRPSVERRPADVEFARQRSHLDGAIAEEHPPRRTQQLF